MQNALGKLRKGQFSLPSKRKTLKRKMNRVSEIMFKTTYFDEQAPILVLNIMSIEHQWHAWNLAIKLIHALNLHHAERSVSLSGIRWTGERMRSRVRH
jgi:hypothetical protein